MYGSSSGLTRERSQLWSQDTPGVRGKAEGEDGFGSVLVTADLGRGDQDDLAIGVGGENGSTGAVSVLYGSTTGLATGGNQLWTQASPGVPGRRTQAQEGFGLSLAAGRFGGLRGSGRRRAHRPGRRPGRGRIGQRAAWLRRRSDQPWRAAVEPADSRDQGHPRGRRLVRLVPGGRSLLRPSQRRLGRRRLW